MIERTIGRIIVCFFGLTAGMTMSVQLLMFLCSVCFIFLAVASKEDRPNAILFLLSMATGFVASLHG